jgi:hypothetical protein
MPTSRPNSEPPRTTISPRQGWISRLLRDVLFVVQRERKWWLLPLILLVLLLAALLIFAAAAGPLAPFIYPLL